MTFEKCTWGFSPVSVHTQKHDLSLTERCKVHAEQTHAHQCWVSSHLPSSCTRATVSCSTKDGILSHWHSARQRSTSASMRYWENERRAVIPAASLCPCPCPRSADTRGVTADCQRKTHWACAKLLHACGKTLGGFVSTDINKSC